MLGGLGGIATIASCTATEDSRADEANTRRPEDSERHASAMATPIGALMPDAGTVLAEGRAEALGRSGLIAAC